MRRKLFCYTFSMMMGICFSHHTTVYVLVLCIAAVLLYWKTLGSLSGFVQVSVVFFITGVVLLQCASLTYSNGVLAELVQNDDQPDLIEGRVIEVVRKDDTSYQMVLETGEEKLLCSYYKPLQEPWCLLGKEIRFYTNVILPEETDNPRCFNYNLYLRSKAIGYSCTVEQFSLLTDTPSLWYRIKAHIIEKREAYVWNMSWDEKTEGFMRGILFGDKSKFSEEDYQAFQDNGTAHVLAVSGLHVGVLYGLYQFVYTCRRHPCYTILFLIFLLVYGTACLWTISVARAVCLVFIKLMGQVLNRRYDLLSGLAAVAMAAMVKNPYVIFGASFQMSFLAVCSMSFLGHSFEKIIGKKFATAGAVQAGLIPYMAYTFNHLSLVGIICNIPIIFLTSVLVPLGMTGFVWYFIFEKSIPLLAELLSGVTAMLIEVNDFFSAEGLTSFDVISPPLWMMVLIYGMMFYFSSEHGQIYLGRKDWKKFLLPVLFICIGAVGACWIGSSPFDRASLVFVDVGQGDCIHLKGDNDQHLLIDGGGNIHYDVGKKILKPYLLKNDVNKIDLAAATHLHTDHYLGIQQLTSCFEVKRQWVSGKAGDRIVIGEHQWIEVLWPVNRDVETEDENLNSLIFMIHDYDVTTLVTGDITAEGEAMLLETYSGTDMLAADILKIPHHGSAYSSSDAFLEAVDPQIAVICVGKNNYGHPSDIVIEKLKKRGIMMFRTDLDGAVGIVNRKGRISVCTEK